MPIYEYRCASCGFKKEYLQKVSDAPIKTCSRCGKETLNKLVTAAGFQLKGSGWYATDFKGSGSGPLKKVDDTKPSEQAPSDSGSGSTPSKKTEDNKPSAQASADSGASTEEKKSAASHSGGSGGCSSCS